MSRNIRSIVVVLILVLGSAAAARAFPLTGHPGAAAERGLLARAWGWIVSLVTPAGSGWMPVWGMAGSQMDPNGEPDSTPGTAPSADEGSQMDPNGGGN